MRSRGGTTWGSDERRFPVCHTNARRSSVCRALLDGLDRILQMQFSQCHAET